jgi:hypothetical protein
MISFWISDVPSGIVIMRALREGSQARVIAAHLMRVFTLANGQKVPTYRAADNRPL